MRETPKMKKIYSNIQNQLFYMIPEGWNKLFLYAAILDKVHGMPIGEMYFYYFPKGILKKKPVNVYEIPNRFNIDEEVYSKLINDLYLEIRKLRDELIESNLKPWTNITISIENSRFTVEYHYDNLSDSKYSNIERHILWKYKYVQTDINTYSKKEKQLIINSLKEKANKEYVETYSEGVYCQMKRNIIGYYTKKFIRQEEQQEEEAKEKIIEKNQILSVNN